jgi:mono/diheme cytochrome c family protein
MKLSFPGLGGFLLVPFLCLANSFQQQPQEQKEAAAPDTASSGERKNPVKPTPENLATAKKFFGYDCAMCHGLTGDGKGDLGSSMSLKMSDWRDPAVLAKLSDAQIFDVIVKGKGKMEGEGDRVSSEKAWELVNYVRALAKSAGAPKAAASQ